MQFVLCLEQVIFICVLDRLRHYLVVFCVMVLLSQVLISLKLLNELSAWQELAGDSNKCRSIFSTFFQSTTKFWVLFADFGIVNTCL